MACIELRSELRRSVRRRAFAQDQRHDWSYEEPQSQHIAVSETAKGTRNKNDQRPDWKRERFAIHMQVEDLYGIVLWLIAAGAIPYVADRNRKVHT